MREQRSVTLLKTTAIDPTLQIIGKWTPFCTKICQFGHTRPTLRLFEAVSGHFNKILSTLPKKLLTNANVQAQKCNFPMFWLMLWESWSATHWEIPPMAPKPSGNGQMSTFWNQNLPDWSQQAYYRHILD